MDRTLRERGKRGSIKRIDFVTFNGLRTFSGLLRERARKEKRRRGGWVDGGLTGGWEETGT